MLSLTGNRISWRMGENENSLRPLLGLGRKFRSAVVDAVFFPSFGILLIFRAFVWLPSMGTIVIYLLGSFTYGDWTRVNHIRGFVYRGRCSCEFYEFECLFFVWLREYPDFTCIDVLNQQSNVACSANWFICAYSFELFIFLMDKVAHF